MSEDPVQYAEKAKRAGVLLSILSRPEEQTPYDSPLRVEAVEKLNKMFSGVYWGVHPDLCRLQIWRRPGVNLPKVMLYHAYYIEEVYSDGDAVVKKNLLAATTGDIGKATCSPSVFALLWPHVPRVEGRPWQEHLLADDD